MPSNYKRLGDYIKSIKKKNSESLYSELLGINIDKFFMPSVANIVGVDLAKYKVVKKNQFACNRMHVGRDYRIPVALSQKDKPFIVSPAYDVFEITKPDVLDPEYLMMWFSRSEFDRNAWFHTDGDVRGGLPWDAFCSLELPVPHIDVQRAMVKEYNTITDRIALNEQLNQKLEETAQTLYRQWFVDFEFPYDFEKGEPSIKGKPYKSNGGEMEWCAELEKDIPRGWDVDVLANSIQHKKGNAFKSDDYTSSGIPVVRVSDLTQKSIDFSDCHYIKSDALNDYLQYALVEDDIIITSVGSGPQNPGSIVGRVIKVPTLNGIALLNQNMIRVRALNPNYQFLLFTILSERNFSEYVLSGAQGSANQRSVTLEHVFSYHVLIPSSWLIEQMNIKLTKIFSSAKSHEQSNVLLTEVKEVLLSKMSTIEVGVGGGVGVG